MNFSHLEYIAVVAHLGSVSRACKELLISQPYLSGVIKNVEDELGIQIFQRTSNGMILTATGKKFMQSTERILSEWQNLQDLKHHSDKDLKIVSYYSHFFLRCYLEMREKHNSLPHDSFREMSLTDCFSALQKQEANMALICYASSAQNYYHTLASSYQCQCETLFSKVPIQVMMRPSHPLSKKSSLQPKELFHYPLVCYEDSLSLLKLFGLEKHPNLMQVADRGTYLGVVEESNYVAINAIIIDKKLSKSGLFFVPLEGDNSLLDFSYVTRNRYILNAREQSFLRLIRKKSIQ